MCFDVPALVIRRLFRPYFVGGIIDRRDVEAAEADAAAELKKIGKTNVAYEGRVVDTPISDDERDDILKHVNCDEESDDNDVETSKAGLFYTTLSLYYYARMDRTDSVNRKIIKESYRYLRKIDNYVEQYESKYGKIS